jgi:hypothetical protein
MKPTRRDVSAGRASTRFLLAAMAVGALAFGLVSLDLAPRGAAPRAASFNLVTPATAGEATHEVRYLPAALAPDAIDTEPLPPQF